jgi:cell division septation protein DedD
MRTPLWRFASSTTVLLFLLFAPFTDTPADAQVIAVNKADGAPAPSLSLDVMVLGLPSSGLKDVGLFFPEPEPGVSSGATGFAIVLPEEEAKALAGNTRAVLIHSLKQPATTNPVKFRLGARPPSAPGDDVEAQPYYEVGISFEVTSNPVSNRGIALSTSSVVQIRRGPGPAGGLAPLLLETQPIKHDVQVQQGKTILLGGLFNETEAARLPDLPAIPESPLLNYVLSKPPRRPEDYEIVVLLTPRRVGGAPEVPPVPVVASPVVSVGPPPPLATSIPALTSLPAPAPPVLASVTTPVTVVASPALIPAPDLVSKPAAPFYTVQVGAFRNRANAEALVVRLKKRFDEVFLEESSAIATPYRVRVGRLSDVRAARQVRAKLTAQGIDSFIVPPGTR